MSEQLLSLLPFVLLLVVFYFLLIKPQKKKEAEVQKLRSSVELGDEVITIGGIIGRVVAIKEDNILLETGGDRNKIRIKRWSIQNVEKVKMD